MRTALMWVALIALGLRAAWAADPATSPNPQILVTFKPAQTGSTQRTGAHGQNHVVDSCAMRRARVLDPFQRPLLGREPSAAGNRCVQHGARRAVRQSIGVPA